MKKYLLIISSLLVLASCQKNDAFFSQAPAEIRASFGDEGSTTKATFYGTPGEISGGQVLYKHQWEQDDDISVFYGDNKNQLYRCKNVSTSGEKYSRFFYMDYAVGTSSVAYTNNYAVYPFDATNVRTAENTIKVKAPAAQTYRANAYGTSYKLDREYGCPVFVGKNGSKGDKDYFNFYNVGCYLRLPVKASGENLTLSKAVLSSKGTDKLNGEITVDMSFSDVPSVAAATTSTDAEKSITLTFTGGLTLSKDATSDTDLYFYLLPAAFTSGFSVKLYDSSNKLIGLAEAAPSTTSDDKKIAATTFARNRVVRMSTWTISPSSIAFSLTVDSWVGGGSTDINLE